MCRLKQLLFLVFFVSNVLSEEGFEVITIASVMPKEANSIVTSVDKLNLDFLNKALAKDLTSLLKNNLAIDVSNNGGMGQLSSVFLRGTNSNHTLVKINGIKINPSTAGGASIYNLDTQLINEVELGYGPLSAIHGSGAIGGVIDISTKPQNRDSKTSLGLSIGPNEFHKSLFKINRDISERGRSKEDVLKQYYATVKPMYDKFIAPSELNADLVVPGLNNELQIEYMYNVILKKLNP